MTERLLARDLMNRSFVEVATDQPLHDALVVLLELEDQDTNPKAVVVVDRNGGFEGVLSAKLLFRSLLALWRPSKSTREDAARLEEELLDVVADRARMKVHDALIRGLPVAQPEDRWFELIERVCEHELEFIPVVEEGKVLGLVPVTEIFFAAAKFALTPGDEGIQLDG